VREHERPWRRKERVTHAIGVYTAQRDDPAASKIGSLTRNRLPSRLVAPDRVTPVDEPTFEEIVVDAPLGESDCTR